MSARKTCIKSAQSFFMSILSIQKGIQKAGGECANCITCIFCTIQLLELNDLIIILFADCTFCRTKICKKSNVFCIFCPFAFLSLHFFRGNRIRKLLGDQKNGSCTLHNLDQLSHLQVLHNEAQMLNWANQLRQVHKAAPHFLLGWHSSVSFHVFVIVSHGVVCAFICLLCVPARERCK